MRLALYIFVNKELGMSGGKIAAQAAQAAVGAYRASEPPVAKQWWEFAGHHTTYVMEARDSAHLRDIEAYLNARNLSTFMMIDEGMTEVPPITPTMLAMEIVDKDDPEITALMSVFKLYKDKKPEVNGIPGQVGPTWWDRLWHNG